MRTHSLCPATRPLAPRLFVSMLAFLCGLISLMASDPGPSDSTPAQKAARVDAIFKSLQGSPPNGKKPPRNETIQITEEELNAYLEKEYRSKPHSGMKSALVKLLDGNRVAADSIIDVDDINTDNSMGLKLLSWMFSGNQSLHAEAKMIFINNTVTYQLERAQLNNVTLPNALVEKLIEILVRKQTQKIDVTKPIPLSDSIKHAEIRQGLLIIQT